MRCSATSDRTGPGSRPRWPCSSGLIRPTSGQARIFGLDAWRDAPAIHRRLAYVPSEANLWPSLTGAEVLRFLGNVHGSVDAAYRDELVGRFELVPDKKVRAYSHGNRQKILLIAAFASRADVLLLDEPTSGLDPLMERVFQACVREAHDRGQTVLLSSHILSEVDAVCDRVAMLRAGRIIETGRLDVLRGLAAVHVRAQLDGAAARPLGTRRGRPTSSSTGRRSSATSPVPSSRCCGCWPRPASTT